MNLVNKGEEMNLRKHVRTAVVTNLYSGNPWSELMQASLPPWVCDQKCYENGCWNSLPCLLIIFVIIFQKIMLTWNVWQAYRVVWGSNNRRGQQVCVVVAGEGKLGSLFLCFVDVRWKQGCTAAARWQYMNVMRGQSLWDSGMRWEGEIERPMTACCKVGLRFWPWAYCVL